MYQRKWRSENKERVKSYSEKYKHNRRRYDMKRWYGITPEDYDNILKSQLGVCAICFKPPKNGKKLVVDHDHLTKKVRGLLHDICNQMLGLAKEDTTILFSAIQYLKENTPV